MKKLFILLTSLLAISGIGIAQPAGGGTGPYPQLPVASATTSGIIGPTNDYEWSQLIPGLHQGVVPSGFIFDQNLQANNSNNLVWLQRLPGKYGFNWLSSPFPGGPYFTNRVSGATSRFGVSRHISFDTNNFPMGLAAYQNMLFKTNGMGWLLWSDPNAISGAGETTPSDAQLIDDGVTLSAWGTGVWLDWTGREYLYEAAVQAIHQATSNNCFVIIGLFENDLTNQSTHAIRALASADGFIWHGSSDPHSWAVVQEGLSFFERVGYKYVNAGKVGLFGTDHFTDNTSYRTINVLASMWGSPVGGSFGVDGGFNTWGVPSAFTNADLGMLRGDATANLCARHPLMTNDLVCLVKPSRTRFGPDYYLFVVNTNASTLKTATVTMQSLNNGQQQSGYILSDPAYAIYDMKNQTWLNSLAASSISLSVASHDYSLYKLCSTNAQVSASATTIYHSATLSSTNSAFLTNDVGVTLGPGTYTVTGTLLAHTASTSGGMYFGLQFSSNPTSMTAGVNMGSQAGDPGGDGSVTTGTYWGTSAFVTSFGTHSRIVDGFSDSNKYATANFNATFVLSAATTLKFYVGQKLANDLSNPAILYPDSYAAITKVQ